MTAFDLNDVQPPANDWDSESDTAQLNDLLTDRIADLAAALFGEPDKRRSTAAELRWKEPSSLSVAISGDRKGSWIWHRPGTKGGPLALIHQQVGSWAEAYRYARDFLGEGALYTPMPRQHAAPSAPRQKPDRAGDIALILPQRQPIKGTLAEEYLTTRKLEIPATDDLFFAADVTDQGAKIGRPAMIGIIRDGAGNPTGGVHRTFLFGGDVKEKKALGDSKGAIRLYPIGDEGRLGAAEGIETAIAAKMRYGVPTWAALNAGNLGDFDIPAECRELFIFADRGTAGETVAEKLKVRAEAHGVVAHVVLPVGDDDHAQDHEDALPLAEIGSPTISIRGLQPADLGGAGFHDSLSILASTTDEHEAAAVALAIVHRFARRVPVAQSSDQFITGLTSLAPISAGTATELRQRLDYITRKRKAGLLGLTSLSRSAMLRHNHHRVADLSFAPFDRGVVVVKAAHGQGKTQKIGRPFADFSRANGERFVAVCHRVSLAAELAHRLDAEDYRSSESVQSDALAICVNSVTKKHDGYCDTVENLFVDEVSQVLRHIALGSGPIKSLFPASVL